MDLGLPNPAPELPDVPSSTLEKFGTNFVANPIFVAQGQQQDFAGEARGEAGGRWGPSEEQQYPGSGNSAEEDIDAGVCTVVSCLFVFHCLILCARTQLALQLTLGRVLHGMYARSVKP